MRIALLILVTSFFALSCRKECNYPNLEDKLKGKLKSLKDTRRNVNEATPIYYYYYDSLTGDISSIKLKIQLSSSDSLFSTLFFITKQNNIIYINNNNNTNIYKIKVNDKILLSISIVDSITGIEQIVMTNNDTVVDNGLLSAVWGNIKFYNFTNNNDNFINYKTEWVETFTGILTYKYNNYNLYFGNINTINGIPYQLPFTVGEIPDITSILSEVLYYLAADGYYVKNPNRFLIDSIISDYQTTYYTYIVDAGRVINAKEVYISSSGLSQFEQEMTYY